MVQERLIEKYMSLPNEIWDSVIQRATAVIFSYIDAEFVCRACMYVNCDSESLFVCVTVVL